MSDKGASTEFTSSDVRWRMLMWALPLAAASSIGGMLNLSNLPAAVPADYWIHGVVAVTFGLLTLWVLGRGRWGQRFEVLLVTLTTVAVSTRLIYALIYQGSYYPPHELLLPFSSYVPLVFVISFAMLPRWPAVLLSMSFYVITTGGIAWYVFRHIEEIHAGGEGIALLQQFVFGHAIYIAVLYVIPSIVRERQGLVEERDELQRQKEAALKRAEQDVTRKTAMEAAAMGAWSVDVDSHTVNLDAQCRLLFGLADGTGQVALEQFLEVVSNTDRDRVRSAVEQALDGSADVDLEFKFYTSEDRRGRVVRLRASMVQHQDGRPARLAGIVWDITESFRLSEDLARKSEQLTRSNAELERFAYTVSHDLQTPLRGIAGFAQLLEHDYSDRLDDRGHEYIGMIVSSVKSMRNLITGLLELSRAGRIDEEARPLLLEHALTAALERLQPLIEERGAQINHGELPRVSGHHEPLAQLLQNLIGNAIKYCPEHSPVVNIEAVRDGALWRIDICDNGMGIGDEDLENVFNVFERSKGAEDIEGSGIGLAVCKRIVNRHGGEIWAEPAQVQGATIHFTLPAADRRE